MNDPAKRLTDDEFKLLLELFQRFCEFDLDQFDHWKLKTDHGDIFVDISRKPSHEAYRDIND